MGKRKADKNGDVPAEGGQEPATVMIRIRPALHDLLRELQVARRSPSVSHLLDELLEDRIRIELIEHGERRLDELRKEARKGRPGG
jgi:hypothetical protein